MENLIKNENYKIDINDLSIDGEGIGKISGFTMFVKDGLVGETLEIKVLKLKKNYGFGKIVNILKSSLDRIDPVCSVFNRCGGCNLQHLSYGGQLKYKKKKVMDSIERIGGFKDQDILDVIGMDSPFFYRNKAAFPVGDVNGFARVGLYARRSHTIVPVKKCYIQNEAVENILEIFEDFLNSNRIKPYNEDNKKGLVRHIIVRTGLKTKEIMVCIVINGNELPFEQDLIEKFSKIHGVRSICLNINKDRTNVIFGKKTKTIWGESYICDFIGDLKFNISAKSFFQVNHVQTEILYKKVAEFAKITDKSVVIDAYCGIGTIALFLSQKAKMVYGVEIVPEAIEDAKNNCILNEIKNVEFVCGEAEKEIPILLEKGIKPDVIVVDPPRKGCHPSLLEVITRVGPKQIVYVSCDPATLARDLKIICGNDKTDNSYEYSIDTILPIDCFPMSGHIETVVVLNNI